MPLSTVSLASQSEPAGMTEATAFAASSLETQGGLLGGVMARGVDWRVDAGGVDVISEAAAGQRHTPSRRAARGCVDTHHTTARGRGRVGARADRVFVCIQKERAIFREEASV